VKNICRKNYGDTKKIIRTGGPNLTAKEIIEARLNFLLLHAQ
jgi:hypothetical protein